jgi:type VI protein secretion system component Hcp
VGLISGLLREFNGGGNIEDYLFCKLHNNKIIKMSSSGAGPGEWAGIWRHEWKTSLAPKRIKRYGD